MKLKITAGVLLSIILLPIIAWTGVTKTEISELYAAILNRASEGEGNRYWRTLELDMATTADLILETDAAIQYFGAGLESNQAFIEHIYLNTLNKTHRQDPEGIAYWTGMLNSGKSRGAVVAALVSAIKDYALGGPEYDPSDAVTIAAGIQFINRVTVSDYMSDIVEKPPADWQTAATFGPTGLNVTDDASSVIAAMNLLDDMVPPIPDCGAYIAPDVWVAFDCYNLAAIGKTTSDDPFTPSWRLIGGYWQWGRKGPEPGQWYDTNTEHFAHGPTGPYAEHANSGPVSGWDQTEAPDGSWSDTRKTANDPCPEGFRVPTEDQWQHVLDNNTQRTEGSWSNNATNYSSARFFGDSLMLPAAGWRSLYNFSLSGRGQSGYYWSSTEEGSQLSAGRLSFGSSGANMYDIHGKERLHGFSVRCIKDVFLPTPLSLDIAPVNGIIEVSDTGTMVVSGGTGEYTAAESSDTGVAAASLGDNGAVTIHGLAPGAVMITVTDSGGSVIRMPVTVKDSISGTCGAFVAPGVWKKFDCYNLAAIGKTTNDHPFLPSWRLIGGYWLWGRKGPGPGQWYDTNTEYFAHGPTGPNEEHVNLSIRPNNGEQIPEPDEDAWLDAHKTAYDPCPEGFRIPTRSQWEGVIDNNRRRAAGTWSSDYDDHTNYSTALYFGDDLMLPTAGIRSTSIVGHGRLWERGSSVQYGSSSGFSSMRFDGISAGMSSGNSYRDWVSVRCIAESSALPPLELAITPPSRIIQTGGNATLTIKGGTGEYATFATSPAGVATIVLEADDAITIHGISPGIATITVTDSSGGTAGLPVTVEISEYPTSGECGAFVAPGVWKEFDCYNLAAIGGTTNDDPFTPSWRLIGGYWQWGRKGPGPGQWYDSNTVHFTHGPVGPDAADANSSEINGWEQTFASDDAWSDREKTVNDPCPEGFRVPSKSQWEGVLRNNILRIGGRWEWDSNAANYSNGLFIGDGLMLPAAGTRSYNNGSLWGLDEFGHYWSSTKRAYYDAWNLSFSRHFMNNSVFNDVTGSDRRDGLPVRCIAE